MKFSDIPGKKELKKHLINSVLNNRISHAQLFLGNPGSANLALALAYSQFINCTKRAEKDSCGTCSSCVKISNLTHPDLHLIFPVIKVKGVKKNISDSFLKQWRGLILTNPYSSLGRWIECLDGDNKTGRQARIYREEATSIHKKLTLKQYESEYRIILLWMPELMSEGVATAMLKIFEEPPKKTIFLLVSTNTNQIIGTVLSRMQVTKIPNFSKKEIEKYYKDHKLEPDEDSVSLFGTNLGQIIDYINEKHEDKGFLNIFSSWMRLVYKIDIKAISEWTDQQKNLGKNYQASFINYAINMIRQCLIYNFTDRSLLKTTAQEEVFISKFSTVIHEENSYLIIKKLEDTIKYIKRNANSNILFFELSLQISKYLKLKRKFVKK